MIFLAFGNHLYSIRKSSIFHILLNKVDSPMEARNTHLFGEVAHRGWRGLFQSCMYLREKQIKYIRNYRSHKNVEGNFLTVQLFVDTT